jgi:cell wall-associated NlpC family hydrolase
MSSSEEKRLEKFMEAGIQQPVAAGTVTASAIIETARGYLGVPHCMGGTTARCMDCSGLIFRVFITHGITLPHNSEEQARYGRIITEREMLMPGDLVFFIRTYSTSRLITHSGIFIGEGRFIHTSSSRGVITTSLNDPYWSDKYLFATRILE